MKKFLFVISIITNSSLLGIKQKTLSAPTPFVAAHKLIKKTPDTKSRTSSEPIIMRIENPQTETVVSRHAKKREARSVYDVLNNDTSAYLATVTITGLTALSIAYKYLG